MKRRVTQVATPTAHLVGPGQLKVVNGQLAFAARGQPPLRLDPAALRRIFCYGRVGVTDEALRLLFARQIAVAWLTPAGNACRGRLVRDDSSLTKLRILQHRALADAAACLALAKHVVHDKIQSQLDAARHYQRHGAPLATDSLAALQGFCTRGAAATDLDQLRGVEGAATSVWFRLFGQLLKPPWKFEARVRRPPTDPVNALLSLGYTWLLARAVAQCEAAGLEAALGALHAYHPGRPSLACDLMEPLRVPLVDRWIVSCCNEGRWTPENFVGNSAGVRLRPAVFPQVLASWEEQWQRNRGDRRLEQMLQSFIERVRRSPILPTPPETGSTKGEGGRDTKCL